MITKQTSQLRALVIMILMAMIICLSGSLLYYAYQANGQNRNQILYVDLTAQPAYAVKGFELSYTHAIPDDAITKTTGLRGYANYFPGEGTQPIFSPFNDKYAEFTLMIPFTLSETEYVQLMQHPDFQPGLFLAGIAANWDIYLNGTLVRAETYLDDEGEIVKYRTMRSVSSMLDRSLFSEGENLLTFRFVGQPASVDNGLFYAAPHYISDYPSIQSNQTDYITILLCTVYAFVGLYHLLLFVMRPNDRENMFYGFFSICTGLYFITRSPVIHLLIDNTLLSVKLEYSAVYALVFFIAAFIERMGHQRILLPTRIYGCIVLVLTIAQTFAELRFAADALMLWQLLALLMFGYMVVYDVIITFARMIKQAFRAHEHERSHRAIFFELLDTPMGNIAASLSILLLTGIYDLLDALVLHTGVMTTRYTFFLFTMGMAVTLARRYTNQFSQVIEDKGMLERSNLSLEAIVEERTRELAQQVELARTASQAKSAFMATMSHEIRTPLNAIIGLGEIVLGQETLTPQMRENMIKITSSGKVLLHIISDVLDISKIEAGNFELVLVEYSTAELIWEAVQLNMARIGQKPLKFQLKVDAMLPTQLQGDEIRVRQVLNNLLSNAIKYTREGSVVLSVELEHLDGFANLLFRIRDTGIGIRPEDMERLFNEYSQLDVKANRKIEGTGLGLAITKKLVDMMGGQIGVESEYGVGSEFVVRLKQPIVDRMPIGEKVKERLESLHLMDSDASKPFAPTRTYDAHVLVVDDITLNLDVAKGLLAPYGLTVDCVSSGFEALDLMRNEKVRYDIVLMDHMMPQMDGVETTQRIRSEINTDYARRVPIIALTANALASSKAMFLSNGFSDFFSKPIDTKKLDALLLKWLSDKPESPLAKKPEAPEKPTREQVPGIPAAIDFHTGVRRYGNEKMLYRLLISFAKSAPALLEKLKTPTLETLEDYVIHVHGLKGACYSICANEVGKLAEQLEHAGKAGDIDAIQAQNPVMLDAANDLLEQLRRLT